MMNVNVEMAVAVTMIAIVKMKDIIVIAIASVLLSALHFAVWAATAAKEFEIIDFDDDAYYGIDTTENCVRELVKLLNELHEENQALKEKIKNLKKVQMIIRDETIEEAIDKIKEMWEWLKNDLNPLLSGIEK